ncbi:type VI secretion system-associated protein TagF [Vibrio sp. 10N]|uniref:type VI secretion system-associated protein TagF n=1 Tax=Vibrio sp. 10N TaxID=3058938 RepID=UPI00281348A9|nr:type VI secretion system-associated protein TagF [Vibrio sp. 10N]
MSQQAMKGFGYFGKVPTRGDFIQSQLPEEFVSAWREWLQAVTAVSREQLAENWLEIYLISPIWHFSLAPQVCGEPAVIGTLMPSVDQVGRHFYMTIAKPVQGDHLAFWEDRQWSESSESKILRLLEDDTDVVRWADGLKTVDWVENIEECDSVQDLSSASEQMILVANQSVTVSQLNRQLLKSRFQRPCVWWTQGSEHIPACTIVSESLPMVSQFSAMLDGNWSQWGW